MNKRIRTAERILKRIRDTSATLPRIEPQVVAKALGADAAGERPEKARQRRSSMRRRLGFSRVDLLVVLLILVAGAGLLMGFVTRVREAAAVAKCKNNLRQLGLATHNYSATFSGRLPPLVDQGKDAPAGRGLPSVFATIMPYIEATPYVFRQELPTERYLAHSSVVFTFDHNGEPFRQIGGMANQSMPLFIDPADTTADRLHDVPMTLPDGTVGYYATGSYAANGMLPWGAADSFQNSFFSRGQANTVLFGERPQLCLTAAGEAIYNLWGLGIYSPNMPAFAALTPGEPPGLWDTGQVAAVEPLPDENAADRDARIQIHLSRRASRFSDATSVGAQGQAV